MISTSSGTTSTAPSISQEEEEKAELVRRLVALEEEE